MPASSAACWKLRNVRVKPGRPSEVLVKRTLLPKKRVSTSHAAALKVLCPEVYDGNAGVTSSGVHDGSAVVSGLPSVSAARMAVTGRQKLKWNLASQQTMPASARATSSSANRRALS